MPSEAASARKVGILISAKPGQASFERGLAAAQSALDQGAQLYLYCIDDGVEGLADARVDRLKTAGAHLYGCAYSLQRRGLPAPPHVTLSGLTILSDIMASADQFQSFN